jgi:hypothetical protein
VGGIVQERILSDRVRFSNFALAPFRRR